MSSAAQVPDFFADTQPDFIPDNGGLSPSTRSIVRQMAQEKFPEDSGRAFARHNQMMMASMTGIVPSEWSPQQKAEFERDRAAGAMATPGGGLITAGMGVGDVVQGNVARGGHKIISGLATTALPLAPGAAVAAPVRFGATALASYLAGKAAKSGSEYFGANEEQQQFAEDLGNVGGGAVANTRLSPNMLARLRAILGIKPSPPGELSGISTTGREVRGPYQPAVDTSVHPSGNVDLPPESPGGLVRTVPAGAGSRAGQSVLSPELRQAFELAADRTVKPSGGMDVVGPGGEVTTVPADSGSLAGQSATIKDVRGEFRLHPNRTVGDNPNVVMHSPPTSIQIPEHLSPQNILNQLRAGAAKAKTPEFPVVPPEAEIADIYGESRSSLPANQRQLATGQSRPAVSAAPAPKVELGPGAEGLMGTTRSVTVNGKTLGSITYEIKGDTAVIHNIGGPKGNYDVMSNTLGRRGVRAIQDQLMAAHPEIKQFEGIRVGGARGEEGRSVRVSAPSAAEPTEPQVPRSDADMMRLLLLSLRRAKASNPGGGSQ